MERVPRSFSWVSIIKLPLIYKVFLVLKALFFNRKSLFYLHRFPSRSHVWEESNQKLRYESEWTSEISMVLTGAAFYARYWHYLFTAAPSPEGK